GKSNRTFEDEALTDEIFKIWHQSGKVYGSPKITQALKQQGFRVSQKRVARLMRENGIKARVATLLSQ
ncbi:IS3 family transposase, partial [Pseudoalteromonas phenolica]|uniref:IS3 family transposase n=1 Tax=Pseudoalteromonas phenolica TaxID=161398 RepID=UPI00110B56A0